MSKECLSNGIIRHNNKNKKKTMNKQNNTGHDISDSLARGQNRYQPIAAANKDSSA